MDNKGQERQKKRQKEGRGRGNRCDKGDISETDRKKNTSARQKKREKEIDMLKKVKGGGTKKEEIKAEKAGMSGSRDLHTQIGRRWMGERQIKRYYNIKETERKEETKIPHKTQKHDPTKL